MRKGEIFMPIVVIGLLVIMGFVIFQIYNHQKSSQEYYSIGMLQTNIIRDAYFGSEKVYLYYEKLLEYNEYKTIKELADDGGVPEICYKKWKFNSDCEPDFKEYFKEILNEKLENKEISINSEIEVYFIDFNLPVKSNTAEVKYEEKITVKKQPLIKFQDLETLKSKIRKCVEDKNMNNCSPESSTGSVYKFKEKIADILNENLETQEIFIEFEVDTKNTGLSIF